MTKAIMQWVKNNIFNKCCWMNWTCEKTYRDPFLSSYSNNNFSWIVDLNVKIKQKSLEDSMGTYLHDLEGGRDFLNET